MPGVIPLPATLMDGTKDLSDARRAAIADLLKEVRLYSRRGKLSTSEKIAYAELEHELLEMEKRWEQLGLINGQGELALAAEAPSRRC